MENVHPFSRLAIYLVSLENVARKRRYSSPPKNINCQQVSVNITSLSAGKMPMLKSLENGISFFFTVQNLNLQYAK